MYEDELLSLVSLGDNDVAIVLDSDALSCVVLPSQVLEVGISVAVLLLTSCLSATSTVNVGVVSLGDV